MRRYESYPLRLERMQNGLSFASFAADNILDFVKYGMKNNWKLITKSKKKAKGHAEEDYPSS